MSRMTLIVLLALGATLAGFALSSNARRLQEDTEDPTRSSQAAGPQEAKLRWRETTGSTSDHFIFSVESLLIRRRGWEARVGVVNASSVPYEIAGTSAPSGFSFGLMLMDTGEQSEVERQNENGTLPSVRRAIRFDPPIPPVLDPGVSWEGTMSAPGALVAGSWVRVVFGPFVSVGSPPEDLPQVLVWFTDHTYRLRP